jgi:hypothetical protein
MEIGMYTLAPGKSFTTDIGWYTSVDGPLILMVVSGQLTLQPNGSALFFPAGTQHRAPMEIQAGTTVLLQPNDTLVYSTADTATGENLGSESAHALIGMVGILDSSVRGAFNSPEDLLMHDHNYIAPIQDVKTEGATVSLQRLELQPFDSFVFDFNPDWRYLPAGDQNLGEGVRVAEGALDGLSPEVRSQYVYSTSSLIYMTPGPHTLFNLGDEPIDIYFLVVEPYPNSAVSTPIP